MSTDSGFQVGRDAPHFYDLHVSGFMAPFVEALVGATITADDAVLDVACGTGFATRAASIAAGPNSRVEGCDLNAAMVAQAQLTPTSAGHLISWRQASALDLPHDDDEFDVAICQQGLQFFPDPAAGVREMARVTARGGHVGVTVWSPAAESPFLDLETDMLARHSGGAPATFSATEDRLRSWFRDGGLPTVLIQRISVDVDLPPVRDFVPQHLRALPWSADFFDLADEQQARAIADLEEGLARYATPTGLTVPFTSYLATATI